jgi:xanthine dehydrogenase iron-sulfur cluster and FAD-binding subunit A
MEIESIMWERYITANTLEEAMHSLNTYGSQARIVAGATDLILELENGLRPKVNTLIDVNRIPGIDQITLDGSGWVHLGPMVTHNHCAGSGLIRDHAFTLAKACWQVGAPQIRNRGTIAGNLITASPANDSITPLMALGAQVTLSSDIGVRVVPLEEFFTGVRQTGLLENELLTDISFPLPSSASKSTFIKLALRRAQAISIVNVAVLVEMDDKHIQKASITMGAVAPTIIHAQEAERYLVGKALTPEVIQKAGDLASKAAHPIDDLRGSAEYRKAMVGVCTSRALRELASGTASKDFPERPVMLWGEQEWHWRQSLSSKIEHLKGTPIEVTINGRSYRFTTGHDKTLLRLLREEAGLIGTKEGCAEGECGACTVFLDGMAVMSCLVPAPRAHGSEIITIEGLAKDGQLHPIQQAFIDEGAVQCGYCTPGFLMSGAKLLEEDPSPSRKEIEQAITGNLCRCTGYYKILSAFEKAALYNKG